MRVHEVWQLTPERVAIHLPSRTAVVADLHLGYSSARQRRGDAVPAPSIADIMGPLAAAAQRHGVSGLVVAGDLFEDGLDELAANDFIVWCGRQRLELRGVVPGNHDRRLAERGSAMPLFAEGYPLEGWLVVHGDRKLPGGPVVLGHFHPAAELAGQLRPCYLVGLESLVLPAYSADARGGPLKRWRGSRCLVPVGDEVLDFGRVRLGGRC